MADAAQALISFGKLISLLDSAGVVQWVWFGDPIQRTLGGMPNNRQHLKDLLRALIDPGGPDKSFSMSGLQWEPINLGDQVGIGFAWNDSGPSLELGVAAGANFDVAGKPIDLAVLAKLIHVANAQLGGDFGALRWAGQFPVPDFLLSGTIEGGFPPISIALTVAESPTRTRQLVLGTPTLAWDCIRVATFVVEAWIHKQAQLNAGEFFQRADEHLFPMFGEPPQQTIGPFPVVQNTGVPADFPPWTSSVLSLGGGASGALTFLWHLRALLTGNESPDFLSGSVFFPLVAGPSSGSVPTLANGIPQGYPPPPAAQGAWFGIEAMDGGALLALDLRDGTGKVARLPLALGSSGNISRPPIEAQHWSNLTGFSVISLTESKQITITSDGALRRVRIFQENPAGQPGFGGIHAVDLVVAQGQPIQYSAVLPGVTLNLPPPPNANATLGSVVEWLLKIGGQVGGGDFASVSDALATYLKSALTGTPDAGAVLSALTGVLGDTAKVTAGPLTLGFTGDNASLGLTFDQVALDQLQEIEVRIKQLKAEAALNMKSGALASFKLDFHDLRLASPAGGAASGVVASLIPDLTKAPGFFLSVAWAAPDKLSVAGSTKIPVQQTIGPLNVVALLLDVNNAALTLGIDLSFALGPIVVSAYELSVRHNFNDGTTVPLLHGLGVSLDTSAVRLAGMFGHVNDDYVGGAVVSVVGMFELSAIGGYTQLQNGESSLFIFASLVAPLGGTPYFFVTGVAGGFGFNRTLPPAGLLYEHPFLKVMAGELDLTGSDVGATLIELSEYFDPVLSVHWIAAGFQFISFGFINGKVIVALQFGHKFSFSILGLAAFGIEPVAYFEIAIEATADEEKFVLKAGLSPNTYLIHPDIFNLQGDFGLGIWYASPHAGDFVLSIGGYHPCFPKPSHYLDLNRLAVKANLGIVRLTIECFFACTPKALMAGASISLSAEFAGIAAGLDVYLDVFITWDPFYLKARMGVTVWFEFCGRHEIGVKLAIWTPDFGGYAEIDLTLVSFEVDFGEPDHHPDPPSFAEFLTQQLSVPAKGGDDAQVALFNTEEAAGLVRIDVTDGRATKEKPAKKSAKQEGVDTPILVKAEFVFMIVTQLPIADAADDGDNKIQGAVQLPLCDAAGESVLEVKPTNIVLPKSTALYDLFPSAHFGLPLPAAQGDQAGARQQVANVKTDDAAIELADGLEYVCEAKRMPASLPDKLANEKDLEPPDPEQLYPLPLGWPGPQTQVFKVPKAPLHFGSQPAPFVVKSPKRLISRRQVARDRARSRTVSPLSVHLRTAEFERPVVVRRLRGLSVAQPPAGVPVIAPPSSPRRGAELYGMTLRIVRPRAPAPVGRIRVPRIRQRLVLRSHVLTPPEGVSGVFRTPITLAPGQAAHVTLTGGRIRRGTVTAAGTQVVRAICLGLTDEVCGDSYVGVNQTSILPARTRRVVMVGEGRDAPISVAGPAVENIGIEHDSALLAVGPRTFAGHGCVVQLKAGLDDAPELLETVAGYDVLRGTSALRIRFPAPRPGSTLVLTVAPIVRDPGSALREIRWLAVDATLRGLSTFVGADKTSFLMSVDAPGAWCLHIDLGREWRLRGAVLCIGGIRELMARLRVRQDWDLVDDRFDQPPSGTSSTVTLEITQ